MENTSKIKAEPEDEDLTMLCVDEEEHSIKQEDDDGMLIF
jgi:hypothetical protein